MVRKLVPLTKTVAKTEKVGLLHPYAIFVLQDRQISSAD